MSTARKSEVKRHRGLAEQVADLLDAQIKRRGFQLGETLPSEAELAKRFDVSRTVIREALARLKHDGILESRQGGRTRVAAEKAGRALRLDMKPSYDQNWIGHLYELRLILEGEAAALAAVRSTKKQLAEIKRCYKKLEDALAAEKEATQESINLHVSIIKASGNPHLTKLVDWIDEKIWSLVKTAPDKYAEEEMKRKVQQEHQEIIRAIEARDGKTAREVAKQHVRNAAVRHSIKMNI